ncbi:hypothetical protein OIU77_007012 [Salix suchowensis]|uniref:J domain-containing protein n=1 Tax=Salix suchowensis TaxID=1278906 RepID=A0ABQ9AMN0_9ROSI|nr:hypothetical protein OIU77_007012 [Salix suchowensis]
MASKLKDSRITLSFWAVDGRFCQIVGSFPLVWKVAVALTFQPDKEYRAEADYRIKDNDKTPKKIDYYKILEVDYDATDEKIRLNYRKLALKWHPDKHKGDEAVTTKFQEINEAYNVLRDPDKRFDYDITGIYEIDKYTLREYLTRFKGMILTCNGLGIGNTSIW